MITTLGTRVYGLWAIIGALTGYFGLLDLGLTSAVQRFVSRELGRKSKSGADGFITTSLYLFSLCGIGVLVLACLCCLLVPIFIADPAEAILVRRLILIIGCVMSISFPIRSLQGVLNAYLRYDLLSLISSGITMLRTALIAYILLDGNGVMEVALIAAGTQVVQG